MVACSGWHWADVVGEDALCFLAVVFHEALDVGGDGFVPILWLAFEIDLWMSMGTYHSGFSVLYREWTLCGFVMMASLNDSGIAVAITAVIEVYSLFPLMELPRECMSAWREESFSGGTVEAHFGRCGV